MAPEIISNKNGKNPYDERIDLWSLGITCIELAEKEPPLSEVHPMRALMQIPIRDPPTLQNTKKWSREFVDFVRECLVKDQKKRHTAEELLNHPFVATLGEDKKCLIQLLEDAKRAKQRVAAEEESSLDEPKPNGLDDDDGDDTPAIPPPVVVSPTNGALSSYAPEKGNRHSMEIGSGSVAADAAPKDRSHSAAPAVNLPPPPSSNNLAAGLHTPPGTMPSSQNGASSSGAQATASPALAAANGANPSNSKKSRQSSEMPTPAIVAPKRAPTVRATLKQPSVTRREMEIKQAKIMNKALIMQQLKELAAQRAIHMKELEKLRKRHKQEADTLETEYKSVTTRLKDTTTRRDEGLQERQTSEMESTQKRHRKDLAGQQETARSDEKKSMRDLDSRQKQQLEKFKESQKATRREQEKEHKEQKKLKKAEQKSLGKKEKVQAEADLKAESAAFKLNLDQLEEQALRKCTYLQARERFVANAEITATVMREAHNKTLEQLWELYDVKDKQMVERHESSRQFDSESNDIERLFMQRRVALQVAQLEKEQALVKQQLEKEQAVEKQQQSKLLKSDQRAALKEWTKVKAQRHKDFLKTSKETMKGKLTLKKEERVAFQNSLTEDFNAKQKALDAEFNAKQLKEMTDEETLLAQHHNSQLEALASDQRTETETMTTEHGKATVALDERIKITTANHARGWWEERFALLQERQKSVMELRKNQHGEQRTLMTTQTSDLVALHTAQLNELHQLMEAQKRSETEIQKMQAEFANEKAEMEAKQRDIESALVEGIRKNVAQIKADHKEARKTLKAIAPPDTNVSTLNHTRTTPPPNGSHAHGDHDGDLHSSESSDDRPSTDASSEGLSVPGSHRHSDSSPSRRGSAQMHGAPGSGILQASAGDLPPAPIPLLQPTPVKRAASEEKAGRRSSAKPSSAPVPPPVPPPMDGSSTPPMGTIGKDTNSSPGHSRQSSAADASAPSPAAPSGAGSTPAKKIKHSRHTSGQSPLPNAIDSPISSPSGSPDVSAKKKKTTKARSKTDITSGVPARSGSPAPGGDSDSE